MKTFKTLLDFTYITTQFALFAFTIATIIEVYS